LLPSVQGINNLQAAELEVWLQQAQIVEYLAPSLAAFDWEDTDALQSKHDSRFLKSASAGSKSGNLAQPRHCADGARPPEQLGVVINPFSKTIRFPT
jgi:hypothetical protein